jgi:aminoglycoside phosphotransferase family enzyme/predicted kinase
MLVYRVAYPGHTRYSLHGWEIQKKGWGNSGARCTLKVARINATEGMTPNRFGISSLNGIIYFDDDLYLTFHSSKPKRIPVTKADSNSDTNNQAAVLSALKDPEFYPHPVAAVHVEETHISTVFLTGDFVYKIKKPVDFGFLDYTTLEKRHQYCQQEAMLNKRLSEDVYLDVVSITEEPRGYSLNGPGEPVEYAVKMRQLPKERTMLRLLRRGAFNLDMLGDLVQMLVRFYQKTDKGPEIDAMGSRELIWVNIEEDFIQTNPFVSTVLDKVQFSELHRLVRTFLNSNAEIFDRRVQTGRIRDCHGDLRLGHIYFTDSISIIDCIEFNDRFRYGDVTSDLAFLAMDLDYNGFADIGQKLLAEYARSAEDPEIFLLVDFYKCYRAHVRCKVECLRYGAGDLSKAEASLAKERAQHYFELAWRYAESFSRRTIWIVCGLSGSGKSTLAAELGKRMNLQYYRSDVVRKRLFGLSPEEQVVAAFGELIYTPEASDKTYEQLLLAARKTISRGRSVILDATFGRRKYRVLARSLAEEMKANVIFIECRCNQSLLRQRLSARKEQKSISDARLQHLDAQSEAFEPLDELRDNLHLTINTEQPLHQCVQEILFMGYLLQNQQGDVRRKQAGE